MISVIIATLNCERALLPTLAALVPAAIDGLVSEVIIADGGSRDGTAGVADSAGCKFISVDGALGRRLRTAASAARAPFLLFLRPGTILDAQWTGDARRFLERPSGQSRAAAFARAADTQAPFREAVLLLVAALGARPRAQQGLLVARKFYEALGGHSEAAADPEAELVRRIGRRRLITLPAKAFAAVPLDP
jgi:glycosyltransferase involved in cell wall biosynthesis